MESIVPRSRDEQRSRWIVSLLLVTVTLALVGMAACGSGSDGGDSAGDDATRAKDEGERLGDWIRRLDDSVDRERVIVFPTWGSRQGEAWLIPVSAWVSEPREELGDKIAAGVAKVKEILGQLPEDGEARLRDRLADWVADGEGGEDLVFRFDGDASGATWPASEMEGRLPETDGDGEAGARLRLTAERAERLLAAQGGSTILTFQPTASEQTGGGRVHLLPVAGLSVVSDVDDTLRVTDNPGGFSTVLRTTFLNPYVALPETRQKIAELADRGARFHYVSNAPIQLFRVYAAWAEEEAGYPRGTWHLRPVPRSVRSVDDLEALPEILSGGGEDGFCHKVRQIDALMTAFPERSVVFLGDSGGCDPEVYRSFRERYGERVEEIWIRDTVDARSRDAQRLAGMTVAEANFLGNADCSVEAQGRSWGEVAEERCL